MHVNRRRHEIRAASLQDQLRAWLASWDFLDDPFGQWEAGREPSLDRYFVRRPFFEELLSQVRSTLIFAPRGGGKTATRLMIEAECRPALSSSAILAVSFTDFSPFLEAYPHLNRLTLNDYVPYLVEAILHRLIMALATSTQALEALSSEQLSSLRACIARYAPDVLAAQRLGDVLARVAPQLDFHQRSDIARRILRQQAVLEYSSVSLQAAIKFLTRLVQLPPVLSDSRARSPSNVVQSVIDLSLGLLALTSTPCSHLYLLIDGADEYALTQDDPAVCADLLRPLLANLHFLELEHLAVKFFLPLEQRPALMSVARLDRLDEILLEWNVPGQGDERNYMREVLHRRLAAFHRNGYIALSELCAPAMRHWIEDALLEEASDSPRNLMRLGHLLFAEHCRNLTEPESVLLPAEWTQAVHRFRASLRPTHETPIPTRSPEVETPPSVPSPIAPLRLDLQAERVFRGPDEVVGLSRNEYRLLAFLYRRRGHICSKDEIAQVVWESREGVSDETINRLVHRLRDRIEPAKQGAPVYLITIKGRGYRLDNTV